MLPYDKAAFHMTGDEGIFNLKFVSKGDQRYEAVYDTDGKLITEEGDGYINMGTYNYIGPDKVSGHIACDVNPYYKYGNIEGTGKGMAAELVQAGGNIVRFLASTAARIHYNTYASQMGLEEVGENNPPVHQPW
jgi:hypothetical protein